MKRSFRPRKTPSNLSQSFHQQLNMYALAAGAAGVGLLALTKPAESKIVYHRANVVIGSGGVQTYQLDLNQDGVADFSLHHSQGTFPCHNFHGGWNRLNATALYNNGIAGARHLPSALDKGVKIGGHYEDFSGGRGTMAYFRHAGFYCPGHLGNWLNAQDKYLGLRFRKHGKIRYGWARLTTALFALKATLTGYAYETIPGKAIKAGQTKGMVDDPTNDDFGPGASLNSPSPDKPQPASLGILALGAQGVPLLRRKETQEVER